MPLSDNKRVAKNTILLSGRMLFVLLVSLYSTRVVLSTLGIDDYGIYNVVCGFVSMFAFLSTSMANATQRFYNYELGKNGDCGLGRIYGASLFIQFAVFLVLLLFAETFGTWYIVHKMVIPQDRLFAGQVIFQLSILSFSCTIFQVPYMAAIMAYEHMGFYAIVTIFDAVFKLVIAFILPVIGSDHLIVYGILMALLSITDFLLYFIYSKKKFGSLRFSFPELSLLKSMLSFSGWNIFGSFANMLRDQGINVVLNLFAGPAVNAARALSYQVLYGLQSFNQFGTAVRPQIVKSYAQENYSRTLNLMFSMSKISFTIFYIVSLPILLEINYVLVLWLGANNIPPFTSQLIILVSVLAVINSLNGAVSAVVHATGIMKTYQIVGGLSTILVLPVSYLYLRAGGNVVGVYVVCIVFALIMQAAALFILKTLIPRFSLFRYFKEVVGGLFSLFILSFPIPFFIHLFFHEGLFRLIFIAFVSVVVSTTVFYFLVVNPEERTLINSMFHLDKVFKSWKKL